MCLELFRLWSITAIFQIKLGELVPYQAICFKREPLRWYRFLTVCMHTHNRFTLCPGLPGWAGSRRNIHPVTLLLLINHPYQLPPSTTNHSIIPAQSTCLQSLCTTSNHVLFGLPLGMEPTTSYSIHFFAQSLSSFHNTCPYHRNLFCCSTDIMSTIPSLSLSSLTDTLIITLVLFIFTLMPLFSMLSFHSFSLLIKSSSVSALTTKSSAYNSSHGKVTLNSQDMASMTITNNNGLNAES